MGFIAQLCCGFFQWDISMDKIMYSLITFIWSYSFPVNICLDQDNIFALVACLQKTSSIRLDRDQYIRLGHTSSRLYQNVLQKRLQDLFKTSSRHSKDLWKRCLAKTSARPLQELLQKRLQGIFNKSSRHFEDVWHLAKMSLFYFFFIYHYFFN